MHAQKTLQRNSANLIRIKISLCRADIPTYSVGMSVTSALKCLQLQPALSSDQDHVFVMHEIGEFHCQLVDHPTLFWYYR